MGQIALSSADWTDVVFSGRNDLVFENKNKVYGAFELRRRYNRTITIALVISSTTFLFVASIPAIMNLFNKQSEAMAVKLINTLVNITPLLPVEEKKLPPSTQPESHPTKTAIFIQPVVTDKKVTEKTETLQEDKTQISNTASDSTGKGDPIIPEVKGVVEAPVKEETFSYVQQMPTFPGGEVEMMKFIQNNIQYPQVEREAGISGTCYLTFVIEKDGSITGVKILKGVSGGSGYDKVAIHAVSSMPSWIAGKQNGKEVRVQFNLPIKFTLK